MENTIAIKLTSKQERSAGREILETLDNAGRHNEATLFTTGQRVDLRKWKDNLEYLIATTKDGRKAFIGRIIDFNDRAKNPNEKPNLEVFPQVPPHGADDKNVWFELSNVQALRIDPGEIFNSAGRDLLELLAGRASCAYVTYSADSWARSSTLKGVR